jgi:hypothetical protein
MVRHPPEAAHESPAAASSGSWFRLPLEPGNAGGVRRATRRALDPLAIFNPGKG